MSENRACSGYDLAAKILETHPNDAIETMLRYSGGAECDWLEFKAGMTLLPEDEKKGDKPDDLYWNYLLSIVAMANTRGGAFVIGVNDKTHKAVSLSSCDPRHVLESDGKEGYLRKEVLDRIDRRERTWVTKEGTVWSLDESIAPHLEGRFVPFEGTDVLVLLVKPVKSGTELYVGQKIKSGDAFESLPFRHLGEAGKVKRLTIRSDWDNYVRTREITAGQFGTWWSELDAEAAVSKAQAKIEEKISEYYRKKAEEAQQQMAAFIPLDAEENVFNSDAELFYSPEAIETIENDDWLDDEDDEDEEESSGLEGVSGEGGFDDDSDGEEGTARDRESDDEDSVGTELPEARKGNLLELLKTEPRVIVSGEPGGGKTTCLTYYTLQHAKADGADRMLAVFIPMGQWKRGGSLGKMMSGVTGLDAAQLHHLIVENRLLLVLDAVNECPDVYRAAAINDIKVFLAENPTVRAVISTRHPNELSALHLPVFHVQPMDEEHRRRYLAHYLGDENEADRLLRQIGTMPGGETIAENPMLLRLVVKVYRTSSDKRLPNGRAGLYRRSLHAWYKREKGKAKNAGIQLRWNERETIAVLAELAFRSRSLGYRDIPLEEVSAIWGEKSDQQIAELCQGPMIYRDDEFLRFRHETYQEYLCAEYLVAHPDELPQWTQADYARWGMPFAYVVELFEQGQKQLPESFWLAAWKLNPWLGVALTDESKGRQLLSPRYPGPRPVIESEPLDARSQTPYLRAVCGTFNERTLWYALREGAAPWYKHEDVALRYVISVSRVCQSRWNAFEKGQLHCLKGLWDKDALKLSKSWLTLDRPREIFQCHAPDEWNGWIENASPNRAKSLVNAKIALPEDFCANKERWTGEMGLRLALRLFSMSILDHHDIERLLPVLLAKAAVKDVAGLMGVGYGDNAFVVEKVQHWIAEATPRIAIALIENGLATKEDFRSRLPEGLNDKSIPSAIFFAKAGLASRVDFEDKLQVWASCATPEMAAELVAVGLMSPSDFAYRLSGWLQHPQYSFVQKYLKTSGELDIVRRNAELVRRWISAASIDSAALLIQDGLAANEDFENKKREWLTFLSDPQCKRALKRMLKFRLIDEREFADFLSIWQACNDVEKGVRTPSDFEFEKDVWIQFANFSGIVQLVLADIMTQKDFDRQIEIWIGNSTPESALILVEKQFAEVKDFAGRAPFWKPLLEPEVAIELIRNNIISEKDLLDVKERWKANIEPKTLCYLIKLGCITLDEAGECLDVWGDAVSDSVHRQVRTMIAIGKMDVGQVVRGKVRSLIDFGAFIDLDGSVGLLHINDMSWGRVKRPGELLKTGQEVNVKVIGIDRENGYIHLGLKQMTVNPWTEIDKKFPVGSRVRGKVTSLAVYGAFVEIAPGIVGLVHISEFRRAQSIKDTPETLKVCDVLQVGQEVEARVVKVDREASKIGLSMRAVSMSDDEFRALVAELNSVENVKPAEGL